MPQVIEIQSEAVADVSYRCSTRLKNGPAQIGNLFDSVVGRLQ